MKRIIYSLVAVGVAGMCAYALWGQPKQPTSEAALIAAFKEAYEDGNTKRILSLVKWHGVTSEMKVFAEQTLTMGAGTCKIEKIELAPFDTSREKPPGVELYDGPPIKFNLQPKWWLIYEAKGDKEKWSARWFVGEEDGKIWLCGPQKP